MSLKPVVPVQMNLISTFKDKNKMIYSSVEKKMKVGEAWEQTFLTLQWVEREESSRETL